MRWGQKLRLGDCVVVWTHTKKKCRGIVSISWVLCDCILGARNTLGLLRGKKLYDFVEFGERGDCVRRVGVKVVKASGPRNCTDCVVVDVLLENNL